MSKPRHEHHNHYNALEIGAPHTLNHAHSRSLDIGYATYEQRLITMNECFFMHLSILTKNKYIQNIYRKKRLDNKMSNSKGEDSKKKIYK